MLRTMREKLNEERKDVAIESMIVDNGFSSVTRDIMLEAMGDRDPLEDEDATDEEIEALINNIPETELDEDYDAYMEGKVVAKDELGDEKEMTLDEVEEQLIPETEEV